MEAAENSNLEVVRLLLDKGADPNENDSLGNTALTYAISQEQWDMVTMLLNRGADPNAPCNPWSTPLSIAAAIGNLGVSSNFWTRALRLTGN